MLRSCCLTLTLLTFIICNSYAQGWLDVGVKAAFGPTFIVNKNIWDDNNIGSTLSLGNSFGAKLGYNFNDYHEVTFDASKTKFKQQLSIRSSDSLRYDKNIIFEVIDFSLLYRHHSNGGYVELGPQYSIVKGAHEKNSIDPEDINTQSYYVANYYSAVFGFGANFMGSDNISLILGCRMVYSLSDIISDAGGRSKNVSYPTNDGYYSATYNSYKTTKPFSAMLIAELNFDLGYFANSSCGKGRTKFISF